MIDLSDDNPLTVDRIKRWQSDTNMYPLVNNRLDYRLLDANVCIDWLIRQLQEKQKAVITAPIPANLGLCSGL